MQYEGPSCHGLGAMNFQSQGRMTKKVEVILIFLKLRAPWRAPGVKFNFFKILTHIITQSKFEVIWSDGLRTVSLKCISVLTSRSW